jgi:hypothetical protein
MDEGVLMSDFFEVDPLTGIRSDFKWNESSQEYTINRYEDVEPALDRAKAMASEGLNREDIKKGWWHYATIPPIVQLQLRAKGILIHDPDHQKRMIQEINTNYPFLKVTTGRLDMRPTKKAKLIV